MRQSRLSYGWVIVGVAAVAMVGTLPGRTQGLGLITEPLLADLSLDRVTYASVNFWATIIGAAGAIGVGRLIDRLGARIVLAAVAVLLGLVVGLMSQVTTLLTLAIAMTLTRALGQSALSVVSIAMVGQWFVRQIDKAMAIYSLILSVGFMMAFPLVGSLIQTWGWRGAWLGIGIALACGLAPLSWLTVRKSSVTPDQEAGDATLAGHRWTEALGTGAFWVFATGAALYGLVASGIGLFNESILAERGLGPDVYYNTLVVTAMTALAGNFLGGWLATRMPITRLMACALFVLALGVSVLPHIATSGAAMAWAAAMGLGGGLVMVLFFSVWPKIFGRRHLGRIQGVAQALTVLASATGPLLLAWCVDATGSYAAMFRILAAVVALTAVAALVVEIPKPIVNHMASPQPAD
jgi:MFS family permease